MNCPYCGSKVELKDSSVLYGGRSFGPAWVCSRFPKCDAYVGCHKGTTTPLGRLANDELRKAKRSAHVAFDALWRTKPKTRGAAYEWLAKQLGITSAGCHIGMFDVETCKRVVEICKPYNWPNDANFAEIIKLT